MADDSGASKSYLPTEHRLKKAREEGNVLFVNQINTSIILFTFFILLSIFIALIYRIYSDTFGLVIKHGNHVDNYIIHSIVTSIGIDVMRSVVAIICIFAAITFVVALIQLKGFRIVGLKIKFESFNIVANAKQKFARKNLIKLILDIFFISIFLFIGFLLCATNIKAIINLIYLDITNQLIFMHYLYMRIIFLTSISLIIFLILLYSVEKFFYIDGLMMTREEVDREYEDREGKMETKQRIREARNEIFEDEDYIDSIMQELGTFTVANPTHYAVLLMYGKDMLPLVLLKGKGELARIIVKKSKQHGLPVIYNKYVVRELYALTNPGDYIPRTLISDMGMIIGRNYQIIKPFMRDKSALTKPRTETNRLFKNK